MIEYAMAVLTAMGFCALYAFRLIRKALKVLEKFEKFLDLPGGKIELAVEDALKGSLGNVEGETTTKKIENFMIEAENEVKNHLKESEENHE